MHNSHAFDGVDDETLECLNGWPKGTKGYYEEKAVIMLLNALCKKHGYGYIPQIAAWIEDVWRNPENVEKHDKQQQERREALKNYPNTSKGADDV